MAVSKLIRKVRRVGRQICCDDCTDFQCELLGIYLSIHGTASHPPSALLPSYPLRPTAQHSSPVTRRVRSKAQTKTIECHSGTVLNESPFQIFPPLLVRPSPVS